MRTSRLISAFALIATCASLSACAKKQLVGKIIDVFGKALSEVTIKIEKTSFQTTSDSTGSYALDYAPGAFTMVFSKPHFTTMRLDFNVAQLTSMPVESTTLYPIPEQPGIYLLTAAELQPLPSAPVRRAVQNSAFGGETRASVPIQSTVTVPKGAIRFIDSDPATLLLARPGPSGLFYKAASIFMATNVTLHRFIDTASTRVGDEKLLVRSVTLEPGHYAFVEMRGNELTGAQPGDKCFPFTVTGQAGGAAQAAAPAAVDATPAVAARDEMTGGKNDADRQKETIAAMRQAGTAMFSWLTDQMGATAPGSAMLDVAGIPVSTYAQLEKLLVPRYIQKLPLNDGWNHPFEYRLNLKNLTAGKDVMSIRSAGRDGNFSATQYAVEGFPQSDYDHDIVWADGYFVAWPK